MNRITQKHDAFNYVLPCQNVLSDTQAFKIQLEDTEYTVKEYIIGDAIKHFGLIEDVLEKHNIESVGELELILQGLKIVRQENTNLKKALEFACKYNIPDNHITLRFEDGVQVENWQGLKEYALQQAKKELKG